MSRQEFLHRRPQRHREDQSVSTFPEKTQRHGGRPDDKADEVLADITEVLIRQEDVARRLGEISTRA